MEIAGLQKLTLLDYPGKVACTVFLGGCNFRCPFCHNAGLIGTNIPSQFSEEEFMDFLKSRRGLLDGVCVSGGEPTLHADLPEFLEKIRSLGYLVKLDTNGCRPEMLRALRRMNLPDYTAMDLKNSPEKYAETAGLPRFDLSPVEESVALLTRDGLPCEFRTTVISEFHDETSMKELGRWLMRITGGRKIGSYYLQPFQDRDTVPSRGLHAPEPVVLKRLLDIALTFSEHAEIRGL